MIRHPAREVVDLAGPWDYHPVARTEFVDGGILVEDTSDLPPPGSMLLPACWADGGLPDDFHGRVRFERDLPEVDGDGWWLVLEGVDYLCDVLVDGVLLTRHEGAFDPVDVRLPASARRLAVVVDAPREQLGTIWPYRKRQFKGIFTQWEPLEAFQSTTGGVWGPVRLERRPPVHVAHVATATYLAPLPEQDVDGAYLDSGRLTCRVVIEVDVFAEAAGDATVSATVCGVTARRIVRAPAGLSRQRLVLTVVDPELWWPWDRGAPVLHELVVTADDDARHSRIGLREIAFDETTGETRVNGSLVRVRGSNVIPEKRLARYSHERAAADAALAVETGLNALRVCVHIAHDAFYDACDEAGLLLWQDLPFQWDYLIDDEMIRNAADQAGRMVRRLHDHPSVLLWSCHNEPFAVNRAAYGGALVRAVQQADGTRPVHAASDFSEHTYHGWFEGHQRDYARPGGSPIVTEFGALSLPSVAETRTLGVDSWPPAGAAWDAVIPEPTPLFDVAGVPLGDTLEELVTASQHYQAEVVQRAVESLRQRRTPFFHFALLDGWPQVSWSVVSYERTPKKAHGALSRACQPILVGATLTREVLSDSWDSRRFPIVADVWVVNDTAEELPRCTWRAELGGTVIAQGGLDVPADGVARWSPPGARWPSWDPPALEAGPVALHLVLTSDDERVLSRNSYLLTFVHRSLALQPPQ